MPTQAEEVVQLLEKIEKKERVRKQEEKEQPPTLLTFLFLEQQGDRW